MIEKVLKIKLRKNEVSARLGARVEILRPVSFFWKTHLEEIRRQLFWGYAYRIDAVLKYGWNWWTGRVEEVSCCQCNGKDYYKIIIRIDGSEK